MFISPMDFNENENPEFQKTTKRSVSLENSPGPKNRVTYKAEDQIIDEYYQKNNYTVIGNHGTFQKLPRIVSAHRFQVDKVSQDQKSAARESMLPEEKQFEKSFYWSAMHRKKYGFRYIALLVLVLFYTLLGATVFYLIEGNYEKSTLEIREKNLDVLLEELAKVLTDLVNDPTKRSEQTMMKDFIKIPREKSSRQHNPQAPIPSCTKSAPAMPLAGALLVQLGIGACSISAETFVGQLFTLIYAFLFVPMTLVILRDLGQLFLVQFTKIYAHVLTLSRKVRGKREVDQDEIIQLPIKYCMLILIGYLLFSTLFVYLYDALMGPEWADGLPFFTAFYFSFISLTTIGLGDVMPNNVPYAPPVSIIFFIGMAVTKVVNRATFHAVENGVFGLMTLAETKIDNWFNRENPKISGNQKIQKTQSPDDKSEDSESLASMDPDQQLSRRRNEMMNTFTVRSIGTFMKSNHDVYGGGFGRVQLRRGDLMKTNNYTVHNINI